jgi:hypothetical protein
MKHRQIVTIAIFVVVIAGLLGAAHMFNAVDFIRQMHGG